MQLQVTLLFPLKTKSIQKEKKKKVLFLCVSHLDEMPVQHSKAQTSAERKLRTKEEQEEDIKS